MFIPLLHSITNLKKYQSYVREFNQHKNSSLQNFILVATTISRDLKVKRYEKHFRHFGVGVIKNNRSPRLLQDTYNSLNGNFTQIFERLSPELNCLTGSLLQETQSFYGWKTTQIFGCLTPELICLT